MPEAGTGTGGRVSQGRFAFVVPVVHPGGRKVQDYAVVERALRETLRSYAAQTHDDTVIVVVCHKVPDWADLVRDKVRFITIDPHPRFEANVHDVQIDKGLKYALGSIYALSVEGAAFVMLADGDDFVRTDLAARAFEADLGVHDGFIVREGYNVLVSVAGEKFRILQALRVQDFDRTCGTCRIFGRAGLARALARLDGGILSWADRMTVAGDGPAIRPDPALLDHLWAVAAPVAEDHWGTIRVLGRHLRQGRVFDFVPVFEPLAAKACGHGNHDGPSRGDVRWSGVLGCAGRSEFIARFGLAGGNVEVGGFDAGSWIQGTAAGGFNRARRLLNVRFAYEKEHATGLKPQG
jgi:hypothetical protein